MDRAQTSNTGSGSELVTHGDQYDPEKESEHRVRDKWRKESPTQAELTKINDKLHSIQRKYSKTNKNTKKGRHHYQENGYNRMIEQHKKRSNNAFQILKEIMKW